MRELQTEGAAVHSKWEPKRKSIGRRFDPLWVGWVLESPVSPTVDDTHSYREIFYIDTYVYILYIVVIVIKYNINNNGHHNNNNSFFVLLSFFFALDTFGVDSHCVVQFTGSPQTDSRMDRPTDRQAQGPRAVHLNYIFFFKWHEEK